MLQECLSILPLGVTWMISVVILAFTAVLFVIDSNARTLEKHLHKLTNEEVSFLCNR